MLVLLSKNNVTKGERMKKCSVLFLLVVSIISFFIGCGGEKKLVGAIPAEGIVVSYEPAAGKTVFYRSDADVLTEFTEKGYHQSSLSKTTRYESFTINSFESGVTSITYGFLNSETGIFREGVFEMQDEEDDLIGQELTISVDENGDLVKWSGLEDLEVDDSGVDQREMLASIYASIYLDHFPPERIKVGSTWKRENSMDVSTSEGDMHQSITKTYTVEDFVEKNGYPCVKCKIKIVFENTGEGTTEGEGEEYAYYNEGVGEGNGTVYFGFESGYTVYSTFNWIIDFTITSVNQNTQEEGEFTYYQEQKVTYNLVDESEIPNE